MPMPIGLVGGKPEKNESNLLLDISFLANDIPKKEASTKVVLADKDASVIMKIWLNAEKVDADTFNVEKVDIDNKELIRLKARGLISGGTSNIKFTERAKNVVKTMALGENNKFLKNKKPKSYTEILANMDKRGKAGYRIASVFDEYSHLLKL